MSIETSVDDHPGPNGKCAKLDPSHPHHGLSQPVPLLSSSSSSLHLHPFHLGLKPFHYPHPLPNITHLQPSAALLWFWSRRGSRLLPFRDTPTRPKATPNAHQRFCRHCPHQERLNASISTPTASNLVYHPQPCQPLLRCRQTAWPRPHPQRKSESVPSAKMKSRSTGHQQTTLTSLSTRPSQHRR